MHVGKGIVTIVFEYQLKLSAQSYGRSGSHVAKTKGFCWYLALVVYQAT